jgi:phosphatidylglycerol:prolipoprotein diacylglycerol transferase
VLRSRLKTRPGALFFAYVGLYSIGRFAIEALRLDSFWLGSVRVPQLASLLGVLVALVGIAWANRRASASPATT